MKRQIIETAHGIAVAVEQDSDERGIFDALGGQHWRPKRIIEEAADKSEARQRRHHLFGEVTAQCRVPIGLLTGAWYRNAAAEIGEKAAVVEIGMRPRDGVGATHVDRIGSSIIPALSRQTR